MKKKTGRRKVDELRPEYDFSQLESRGIGRYYERCKAGPIVVLLTADDEKPARTPTKRRPARSTTAAKKPKKPKRTRRRS